jgi:F420-0:gamma-glutamyl ligase-like protein
LVIAETPIAISQGRLIDESEFTPSLKAKILAVLWSKYIWGYILGPLLGIKKRTIKNLRKLHPEASVHKEVILQVYGLKHALKPASEAGVDLSNAPGTLVSLLPENPQETAINISKYLKKTVHKDVTVLIVDTDATYKRKGKYFTALPIAMDNIQSNKGIWGYTLGQLSENCGSTPLGVSNDISVDKAIKIANICENYQKSLETNMETFYSMKKILTKNKKENDVTLEALNSIIHTPAIVVREKPLEKDK